MSTNRQPDSKPTVRENGIFRGALKGRSAPRFLRRGVGRRRLISLCHNCPQTQTIIAFLAEKKSEEASS